MSKKLILAVVVFAGLVLGGFAAKGFLGSTFFQWYLKGYCRTCLASRLSYESVRHENGRWIFDQPVLTTKKRLEEGGYRCQAESASVEATISWLEGRVDLSVHVETPHLDIGKGGKDLLAVLGQPAQTFHLFEVHTEFNVPEGTIFVHDFTEDHLVPAPLFFQINLACKDIKKGCVALWLGGKENKDPSFQAIFTENGSGEPRIQLEFNDFNCSHLQPVIWGLWPESKNFEIAKGNIKGKVDVSFSEDASHYAEGEVFLNDLLLNQNETDWQISVSEIGFRLTPMPGEDQGKTSVRTIGSFLVSPSEIVLKKYGAHFWSIEGIQGSAAFVGGDYANFSLAGKVLSNGRHRHVQAEGKGRFAKEGPASFSIDLNLTGEEGGPPTNFHFHAKELENPWCVGEVEVAGFGREELDLTQYLISKDYPQWQHVHIHQGNLDAALLVYLDGFRLSGVKVERIAAHRLAFSYDPWDLYAKIESALGSLSFDLAHDHPLSTLDADLKIKQGRLSLEGISKAFWQLSDIDTNLTLRQGIFQKSLLKGTIAGLKGEVELDGTSGDPLMHFSFNGKAKDLAQALPDPLSKGIEKKFASDELRITGEAEKADGGLLFKGKALFGSSGGPVEKIFFGFTLRRPSQELWTPLPFALEYSPKSDLEGFESLQGMVPPLALPLYSAYRHLMSQDFGISGFKIKDGWFWAHSLPLNKYLSTFLFQDDQMELDGIGEFSGQYDGKKLVVNYDARDLVLKNGDFAIEIKSLSERDLLSSRHLPATFLFDFDKKLSFNKFRIRNATYFEKNSGLLFTDVNALLSMKGATAHFDDLTAYCNGLYFSGTSDVDWSMPGEGVFEVSLHANQMHGKISQLQHLLSHLNPSLVFLKIPIEGNATLNNEGGRLHFFFQKEGYEIESDVQGSLTDGVIAVPLADLSLQELNMNFHYNHKKSILEFTDIMGTLLAGKPNHVEEYTLAGDKLGFTDYSRSEAEFDLWVGDKARDFIRLTGKTHAAVRDDGVSYVNFIFNPSLTHFGDIHPSIFQLGLKDWSQLELFRLAFDFDLENFLPDLKRFSRTGLFFLSKGLLKELNEIQNAKGNFHADLKYDAERSILNYHMEGENLFLGQRGLKNFLLSGTKKGSLWSVDQLQFDDLSLAIDVLKDGPLWNINFLGARIGDYLLIGMEGQYSDDDSRLNAKIHLLEADLAKLRDHPFLHLSDLASQVSGQLRASGAFHAAFDRSEPNGALFNLQLNGSLSKVKVKEFLLEDIPNLSFGYDSKKGISIGNLSTRIKSSDSTRVAGLFLQEAGYDLSNHEFLVDGLYFDIPAENLAWSMNSLQFHFPGMISEPIADVITSTKTRGSLQGSLRLSFSDTYSSLRLNLHDGIYHFMGNEHELSGLVVDYDPYSLKIFTEYKYKTRRLRLNAHSASPKFDSGEILVSDLSDGMASSSPLMIYWRIHPEAGYFIQKITGNLSGIAFDLVQDPNRPPSDKYLSLVGTLDLDFHKTSSIIEDRIASKIADLELGRGYSLIGQWSILKESSKSFADRLFFQGELAGRDFEFYGYRFYQMSAQLTYSPETAQVRSLAVVDPCATMQAEQADFFHQGEGIWHASVPSIAIKDFRPSLLRPLETPPPRIAKSLVVRTLDFHGLNGTLGDKNSFKGTGQLIFANPPKKHLHHSFLAVPAELLGRLGLDLAVLTPIRGTLFFDIKDGKAVMKRFKDVYSKGRLSKFYLSKNKTESYVDFNGNLNLQIRMKQYNIFFKLAELFTFTVQGTLKKPTYALLNHQTSK